MNSDSLLHPMCVVSINQYKVNIVKSNIVMCPNLANKIPNMLLVRIELEMCDGAQYH
ncbi:hypothetical protein VIBNISFn118_1030026 [Vibrio nigripulchritudo SFn118]|nr:hypothetical protein VIBNISFn118_1030026 [Vibrio nigripulchritudo SFn118]